MEIPIPYNTGQPAQENRGANGYDDNRDHGSTARLFYGEFLQTNTKQDRDQNGTDHGNG